jgi:hypothetical protein
MTFPPCELYDESVLRPQDFRLVKIAHNQNRPLRFSNSATSGQTGQHLPVPPDDGLNRPHGVRQARGLSFFASPILPPRSAWRHALGSG